MALGEKSAQITTEGPLAISPEALCGPTKAYALTYASPAHRTGHGTSFVTSFALRMGFFPSPALLTRLFFPPPALPFMNRPALRISPLFSAPDLPLVKRALRCA